MYFFQFYHLAHFISFISVDSRIYPQTSFILYQTFRRSLPTPLANFLCRFPTREEARLQNFANVSKKIAKSVFRNAVRETNGDDDLKGSKDVLSVLVHSNLSEDSKKALDEDEVLSQMA